LAAVAKNIAGSNRRAPVFAPRWSFSIFSMCDGSMIAAANLCKIAHLRWRHREITGCLVLVGRWLRSASLPAEKPALVLAPTPRFPGVGVFWAMTGKEGEKTRTGRLQPISGLFFDARRTALSLTIGAQGGRGRNPSGLTSRKPYGA
jgi:hypothetical protein